MLLINVCHHLMVLLCPKASHTATIIKVGGELLIYQNHLAVSFVTGCNIFLLFLPAQLSSAGFKLDK